MRYHVGCLPSRRRLSWKHLSREEQVDLVAPTLVKVIDEWVALKDWRRIAKGSAVLWFICKTSLPACRVVCSSGVSSVLLQALEQTVKLNARTSATRQQSQNHDSIGYAACLRAADSATGILLECAMASERCADDLMESECCRLLLQLLSEPMYGGRTKQHVASLLHYLTTAKLVYRDILQGAGKRLTLLLGELRCVAAPVTMP